MHCDNRILPSAVTNETATLTRIYHDQSKHISNKCPTTPCQVYSCHIIFSANIIFELQNCPIRSVDAEVSLGRQKIRKAIRDENSAIREGNSVPKVSCKTLVL